MDSGDGNEMVKGFWWYVTMVHDGSDDIIYVNGVETKRKPAAGKLNSTTLPLCFGSNPVDGKQYFIGALDNVKIYNRALTGEEAARLYQTGSIVSSTEELEGAVFIDGVYPNPAQQEVVVKHHFSGEAVVVRVFDAQGRQYTQQMLQGQSLDSGALRLNISDYPAGMYHIQFSNAKGHLGSTPFVKK